ncbi:MAG TPA: hypothetical protein VLB44_26335 [Kofleriaceae bacterium]|nr:hypothetical protein [Kofleriaceae bacterium]
MRWFVPAVIVGAWAGVAAQRYLDYLAGAMHAWTRNSAFVLITSSAVGVAAFLLTRFVIEQPEPRIPPARIPSWMPRLGFRTMGLLAIISTLLQVDRAERRLLPPPPPSTELSDAHPILIDRVPEPMPRGPLGCQTRSTETLTW